MVYIIRVNKNICDETKILVRIIEVPQNTSRSRDQSLVPFLCALVMDELTRHIQEGCHSCVCYSSLLYIKLCDTQWS